MLGSHVPANAYMEVSGLAQPELLFEGDEVVREC
jgi:hypothetical protein